MGYLQLPHVQIFLMVNMKKVKFSHNLELIIGFNNKNANENCDVTISLIVY